MSKKPIVTFRKTIKSDGQWLGKWLLEENALDGFPMETKVEIDDGVNYWMQFCDIGASITSLYKKQVCGIANLYIRGIEKLSHHCLFVIIVDSVYRNMGIGKMLIQRLEKLAKKEFGIKTLVLEIYEGNQAVNLYTRLGFSKVGVHKAFLIDKKGKSFDKIIMEKHL